MINEKLETLKNKVSDFFICVGSEKSIEVQDIKNSTRIDYGLVDTNEEVTFYVTRHGKIIFNGVEKVTYKEGKLAVESIGDTSCSDQ